MNLPTSEPLEAPEDNLSPARRRRQNRMVLPDPVDERSRYMDELGLRAAPGAEFFLYALLAGLVFGAAMQFDSPALAVLVALVVPFMGPVLSLSLATVAGSRGFFLRSLGSLLTGSLIFFLTSTLAGWVTRLVPAAGFTQAATHLQVTWPDLILLSVGVALSVYLLVKSPQQRPLVSSVAIAYEIFLPLGAAGYALTSGSGLPWASGLLVFAAHLVWSALIGTLTLTVLGFRPFKPAGYTLAGLYALVCLVVAFFAFGQNISLQLPSAPPVVGAALLSSTAAASATPSPSQNSSPAAPAQVEAQAAAPSTPTPQLTSSLTPTATPTHTLVPSSTPTQTVTPMATPVWARINAKGGNGAFIREKPDYDSNVVQVLLNGILVQVLQDVTATDQATWVKVRTADGKEGWIVRSLLATATPAPGW
jgi:uncharacterized membrane protein